MRRLTMGLLFEILISGIVAFVLVQLIIPGGESVVPEVGVKVGEVIYSSSSTISASRGSRLVTGYMIDNRDGQISREFEQVQVAQEEVFKERSREKEATSSNMLKEGEAAKPRSVSLKGRKGNSVSSDEILNPYIIEKIIQGSDKTYRFSEKYIERQGVKVELISITPRGKDYFLKFSIKNSSKDYFIPQGWACRYGEVWVEVEKFFPKYLIEADEVAVGYLRVKASYDGVPGRSDWVFQLQESGGAYRKFSIFY